jgi:hypothetical protein
VTAERNEILGGPKFKFADAGDTVRWWSNGTHGIAITIDLIEHLAAASGHPPDDQETNVRILARNGKWRSIDDPDTPCWPKRWAPVKDTLSTYR